MSTPFDHNPSQPQEDGIAPVAESIAQDLPKQDTTLVSSPPVIENTRYSDYSLPLHPSFWWALLWCGGILLFTQVPAGVLFGILLIGYLILSGRINDPAIQNPAELMNDPIVQNGMAGAIAFAHVLIIVFSLLFIRVFCGKNWRREIALRRPSLFHTLMVVGIAPAFIILANVVYTTLSKTLGVPSAAKLPQTLAFLAALLVTLGVFGFVSLVMWLIRRPSAGQVASPNITLRDVVIFLLVAGVFIGMTTGLFQLFSLQLVNMKFGTESASDMKQLENMVRSWPLILGVLVIGVLPGISEELWSRGFLGRGLVGKHGYLWGVMMASFLFGLIHVDPCQGTMAMVVGMILHYVYLTTRSILLPMLLHFLNNSVSVIVTQFPQLEVLEKVPFASELPVWISAAMVLLSVGSILYVTRSRIQPSEDIDWLPPYPGVNLPPAWSKGRVVSAPAPPRLLALVCFSILSLCVTIGLVVMTVVKR